MISWRNFGFSFDELRFSHKIVVLSDLNIDFASFEASENDDRRVLLEGFMRQFGLGRTYPR